MTRTKTTVAVAAVFFAVVVSTVSLWALNNFYRFDLLTNPVVQIAYGIGEPWGTRRSLVPEVWQQGTAGTKVRDDLEYMGFAPRVVGFGAPDFSPQLKGGEEVFVRDVSKFPCNMEAYVVVNFLQDDSLESAETAIYERGCL